MRLPRKVLEQAAFHGHRQGRSLHVPMSVPYDLVANVQRSAAFYAIYLDVELPVLGRVRRHSATGRGEQTQSSISPSWHEEY